MPTGDSADGDREQKLQCKSHILKSAMPKPLNWESFGFFRGVSKQWPSSTPADVWLAKSRKRIGVSVMVFGGVGQIPYHQTAELTTPLNPIMEEQQPRHAQAVRDEVSFARTSAMLSFVLAQLLSPLPRFSVPVQFTPYNSLKVFDISKPSGPGVADVAGFAST